MTLVSSGSFENEIDRIHALQRERWRSSAPPNADERIDKLRKLERAMLDRRAEIRAALWEDFRKPAGEADLTDIYAVIAEARHARRHLRKWMKARSVSTPIAFLGSRSRILYEPKGVVLVIGPWNFPFNLTFGPLVSAIAAGNRVIIKPSEVTPKSSACMKRIAADLFDESEVAVIEGDAQVAGALLKRKFDHIFFTGGPAIGKIIMKAAAENLTSVTLELGGKSPVIVDRTANLDEAAKKIAWGKAMNSGQVCIAPDYLLVDESVRAPFLEKLKVQLEKMGAEGSCSIIVNDHHARRVGSLLDEAVAAGAKIYSGGKADGRKIAPTIVENVKPDARLMQEEIFGPVLPVVPYATVDEAMAFVNSKEKPLALYVFSRSREVIDRILAGTSAGGSAVNETVLHFLQTNLPFGGINQSGIGRAHGYFGFEAFSNVRGVMEQPFTFAAIQLMYPPYNAFKQKLIDLTLKYF